MNCKDDMKGTTAAPSVNNLNITIIEYRSATSCCHGDGASGSKQNYTCFAYVQIATESKLFSSKAELFK